MSSVDFSWILWFGFFGFFKIKIPFSYSSRVVENKIRKEIYFLLFLKPLLVITSLVMAKEEYCTELIYLIFKKIFIGV